MQRVAWGVQLESKIFKAKMDQADKPANPLTPRLKPTEAPYNRYSKDHHLLINCTYYERNTANLVDPETTADGANTTFLSCKHKPEPNTDAARPLLFPLFAEDLPSHTP